MIDTDKYREFLTKHAPSTKKQIFVPETESGRVQGELWFTAMSCLREVNWLREDIADLVVCLDNSQDPSWFIDKYNRMAQTMLKEGKVWYGQRGEEE